MGYKDFAVIVAAQQGNGYPVSVVAEDLGRVSGTMPLLDAELASLLQRAASQSLGDADEALVRRCGTALFRWLFSAPLETQLRLALDRAARTSSSVRIRLSIDPPEIAALPWEMMYDPARSVCLSTAAGGLLVRFLDQAATFGPLAEGAAAWPLEMLLVLPRAAQLDLAQEQAVIQEAVSSLRGSLRVKVLDGIVTRSRLGEALAAGPFHLVHLTGHGGYIDGHGYVELNYEDGTPDWVDGEALVRMLAGKAGPRLLVMNVCGSGQVDETKAFRGLAPQLVRAGVPAVVAMQYLISDRAALTFAREFYRELCTGEHAGQVDAAVCAARQSLASLHPLELAFAAPVLYTHARDGILFVPPAAGQRQVAAEVAGSHGDGDAVRLAVFMSSLQSSMTMVDDWHFADREELAEWQTVLAWSERAYCAHLNDRDPAARQAARHGLTLVQQRLAALEARLKQLARR